MKINKTVALFCGLFFIQIFYHDSFAMNEGNIIYYDKKNEYFIFAPPDKWIIKEYSDPRTKLSIHNPKDHEIYIRIIVEENPSDTFEKIRTRATQTCNKVIKAGISCKITEEEIAKKQALIVNLLIPSIGVQKLIQFVESGLFFNISFNARTEKKFLDHEEEMEQSIKTIQLINQQRIVDNIKVKDQLFAGSVRIAELLSNMGHPDLSCRIINDLLIEYPDNRKLHESMMNIGCQ